MLPSCMSLSKWLLSTTWLMTALEKPRSPFAYKRDCTSDIVLVLVADKPLRVKMTLKMKLETKIMIWC